MELCEFYLQTGTEHIAYIKFIFESYEHVGIIRTVDRKKAIIVLLVVPDFADVARRILTSLEQDVPLAEIPRPTSINDDWLMAELAVEETGLES
jgi:uncharacterized protein DUF4911